MRCLLIYCHPVPESFALRDAAAETLAARGWELRLVDLYADGFQPVLSAQEHRAYHDGAPADPRLEPYIEGLRWAEAILFVYPTWWYGRPAMLKGWLDRVWATEVAFRLPGDGGRIVSLITHVRKTGVVTTCGAPFLWSWLIGQPGRKTILRGMRALCAPRSRSLYLAHHGMDRSNPESRAAFLGKVRTKLQRF